MALPTSTKWSLADFNAANLETLLALPFDDLSITPATDPYFSYAASQEVVHVRSNDGVEASLTFNTGVPARFTFECLIRCPALPNNLGDLNARRAGFTIADDAGRGVVLYFAQSGVAISRLDDFGSVTALPGTDDVTTAVGTSFYTVRVAIDGGLGRGYIFVGQGDTPAPALRWIVPVEATPKGSSDLFRVFAKGTDSEPVHFELKALRLGTGLIVASFPPTAIAGPDRVAVVGSAVRFDGRASYDIEGAPLSYRWQCIEVPHNSIFAATISGASTEDDGDGDGTTPFISVSSSALPDWVTVGDIVRLDGKIHEILFVDRNAGHLEMVVDEVSDALVNRPLQIIRQNILLDTWSPTPTAIPDAPGIYRFRLIVDDGDAASEPSEVLASIQATQAALQVEPDVSMIWKAIGDEWRFIDGAKVFEEVWIGTAQLLAGRLLEAWQYHYNTSARDAQQVFQRKWQAYRTLVAEEEPEEATLLPRYGAFVARAPFEQGPAPVAGLTLGIDILETNGQFRRVSVTFTTGGVQSIVEEINDAVGLEDIKAEARAARIAGVAVSDARLVLWGTRPFRLYGSACAALGLVEGQYNALGGMDGSRITDRTYYVGEHDLLLHGVQRGDLLVLNHGESFRIDRVLSSPDDPGPNRRVLVFDPLPIDAGEAWSIPSVFRSAATDYEAQGVYPGDLLKVETSSSPAGAVTALAWVVAQKERQLAVELSTELHTAVLAKRELRPLGVKRRRAIPLPANVVSIPALQEMIAQRLNPVQYKEQVDYVLEPFYRGADGSPQPMLQFKSHVFEEPSAEPADVLWAELTLYDNAPNVEDLFGRLVGFLRDDAATLPPDFNYVSGVFGLLYAQQQGPRLFAMAVGAQILLGQPFAEVPGTIVEIRPQYSPRQGRLLLLDSAGQVRAYYYAKSATDQSETSGLAINPNTSEPWKLGEQVPQFSALGGGVSIDDIYSKPLWWRSYAGAGIMKEVEKFHRFAVNFDTGLVSLANLGLLHSLIHRIKPTHTRFLLSGAYEAEADIDVEDDLAPSLALLPYDAMHVKLGYRHDDYMGDGRTSSRWDDGVTRYDGLIDNVLDTIEVCATISWPGGTLYMPHASVPFQADTPVVDINGTQTGTAGQSFTPTNGMPLAAGQYRTCIATKTGPILPLP